FPSHESELPLVRAIKSGRVNGKLTLCFLESVKDKDAVAVAICNRPAEFPELDYAYTCQTSATHPKWGQIQINFESRLLKSIPAVVGVVREGDHLKSSFNCLYMGN